MINKLKNLVNKVGLAAFNMALNEYFDRGRDNLTNKTYINNMMSTLHDVYKDVKNPIITEDYMRTVLITAVEIASFPVATVYEYICRYGINANNCDYNVITKERLASLLKDSLNSVLSICVHKDNDEALDTLYEMGFTNSEIALLGYDHLYDDGDDNDEEAKNNDDDTHPALFLDEEEDLDDVSC